MADYRLSFTAKEIDDRLKKLDNIQSDYEQNDSSADNYIKNRPFYTGDFVEVELFDASETTWGNDGTLVDDINYIWQTELPLIGLEEGKTYAVSINNTKYSGVAQNLKETMGAPFDVFGIGDVEAFMSQDFESFTYAIEEVPLYGASIIVWKGPEAPTECKIYGFEREVKKIDPKYLPEGGFGYEETFPEEIIVEEQTIEGFDIMENSIYAVENPFSITLIPGNDYIVTWDGTEYKLTCEEYNDECVYIGNLNYVEMASGGDIPFTVLSWGGIYIATESTDNSHTIEIVQPSHFKTYQIDEKFIPHESPDWNENDSEAKGYIKNRPFYEDYEPDDIILEQTTIEADSGYPYGYYGVTETAFILEENKNYFVILNNNIYNCTAWACETFDGNLVLGNGELVAVNGMGEDVPFVIAPDNTELLLYVPEAGNYTLKIAEPALAVHELNEKYLPIFQKELETYYGVLCEEQTFELDEVLEAQLPDSVIIEAGKEYAITFNEEQYSLTAWTSAADSPSICLGNGNIIDEDDLGDDVPFVCVYDVSGCYLLVVESGTYTIKIEGDLLTRKIDPKYLPDNIGGTTLTEAVDSITFKDAKTEWEYIGYIYDGNWITCRKFESVEITQMPEKMNYYEDDIFDPTGMIITGTYSDGDTKEIKNYDYQDSISEEFKIFCIDGGVYVTLNLYIIPPAPEDFEYIEDTEAGTYTLTGWKGTYNGESSSEMIIPDRDNIIL